LNIQLPTGKTVSVSVYEYYFILKEEDVAMFYQDCIADDLGVNVENPFYGMAPSARLDIQEEEELEIINI